MCGGYASSAHEPSDAMIDVEHLLDGLSDIASLNVFGNIESGSEASNYDPSIRPMESLSVAPSTSSVDLSGCDPKRQLEKSWSRLEPNQFKQVWGDDFWSAIFSEGHDPLDAMMKQQHKRPFEPETCGVPPSEEVVQISQVGKSEKVREDFRQVVQNLSVHNWKEEREAQWETMIRRWTSMIITWK